MQRAELAPASVTPADADQLQSAIGNQAVNQLIKTYSGAVHGIAQRQETSDLPSLPDVSLTPPSSLQPPSPRGFGLDLELQLDPEIQAMMRQHVHERSEPANLRAALLDLSLGPMPAGPDLTAPPSTEPTPLVPAGAGPDTPRSATGGDLMESILAIPAVDTALTNLQTQALDQLERDWQRLSTGEQVGVASSLAVIGIGALGGAMANPESRQWLLGQLNGRVLPVPGVDPLRLELNTSGDNLMVGLHLDVGRLLPQSWGFGPSAPHPIGAPPTPEPGPLGSIQRANEGKSVPKRDVFFRHDGDGRATVQRTADGERPLPPKVAVLPSSGPAHAVTVQRSPLSEDLEGVWLEQGRETFFERLRNINQSDGDVLALVNRTLQGDDWLLARNIIGVPLTQEEIDTIVRERIESELEQFQHIPVVVTGSVPMSENNMTVPVPVTRFVEVEAAYFINTTTAQAHYHDERDEADFRAIIRALRERHGRMSMIEGAGGARTVGRAVELGKATPDEVRLFIEEGLAQGSIQRHALQNNSLLPDQQLIELTEHDLTTVIEDWINDTGVGVDCSGFVMQAAIHAREDVRAALTATGVPADQLPAEIGHQERRAQSFSSGPQVSSPANLRPGDAWVVSGGGHIRILGNVRTVTLPDGSETIEFETAESSGGSTQAAPGPVGRTWRTRSTTHFNPITREGHTGGAIGGSFHRIP
ncbi:MAG: hypothetical protein ACE5EY_00460 [Anaerolineae bacterium]